MHMWTTFMTRERVRMIKRKNKASMENANDVSQADRHTHARRGSGKESLPIFFGKTLERDKSLKGNFSIFWCLHAFAESMVGPQRCDTLHNLGRSFGVLTGHNRNAELLSNRNKIEGGSRANHDNTGNYHGLKNGEPCRLPSFVIILVRSD